MARGTAEEASASGAMRLASTLQHSKCREFGPSARGRYWMARCGHLFSVALGRTQLTTAARLVLQDCRQALQEFTGDIQGSRWRIVYMANLALLRAVYHVLKLRDVPNDPQLSAAFARWDAQLLRTKPRPEIYWEFIVDERNQLLKEYLPTPVQNTTVPEVQFDISSGETRDLGTMRQQYTMTEGHFAGQEQRRLIKLAIEWWQEQLASLELNAQAP